MAPVLVGSAVRFRRWLGLSFVAGLPRVPVWLLAVGSVASLDTIRFVVWLPVLVVGEAPVWVGSVLILASWMFAPVGVELLSYGTVPICGSVFAFGSGPGLELLHLSLQI